MDSFKIKLLAIVSMVIDHIGVVFYPDVPDFRIYGRLAFPLFAFLIAEGYIKTSNVKKYLWKLLTLAVISQIPFILMMRLSGVYDIYLNIFFTLSAGLIGLILIREYPNFLSVCFTIIGLGLLVTVFRFDYGIYGLLLILSSHLFVQSKMIGTLVIVLLTAVSVALSDYTHMYILQIIALTALPVMYSYNGKQGNNKFKNMLYYVYPVSICITVLIGYGFSAFQK